MKKCIGYMLLFCMIFSLGTLNAQDKKIKRLKQEKIEFRYKAGVHKLNIPGSSSFYTITIEGRNPKIKSITRTEKGRTYKLKPSGTKTCKLDCPCGIECWEDPILKQSICVCRPCSGGGGRSAAADGAISYVGPCDAS